MNKPNDRFFLNDTIKNAGNQNPQILKSAELKIPDKEISIMQKEETASSGTCSCNSVCSCVPVETCSCDAVCTCDSVCSANTCTCNPFAGCPEHSCNCQPHSTGGGGGCYAVVCSCNSIMIF
jgi:hypothetical protein